MRCRTPESCKFKRCLGFKLHNKIICKEQTVLESVIDVFERENMQTQYNVLGCKIYLYYHEHKLPIEVDELGHNDRNIDYERQKQNKTKTEKELGCVFIRINPDEKMFNIFKGISEIH